jgi:hypothetical protein
MVVSFVIVDRMDWMMGRWEEFICQDAKSHQGVHGCTTPRHGTKQLAAWNRR